MCDFDKLTFVSHLRNDATRNAAKCNSCGHVQITPLPTAAEDEQYYKSDKMMKGIFGKVKTLQSDEQLMERMKPFIQEQTNTVIKNIEKYTSKDSRMPFTGGNKKNLILHLIRCFCQSL